MATLSNYPKGITSFGIPIIGSGGGLIPTTTGTYFFVNSVTGSAGNDGLSPAAPLLTVQQAITKCTASAGDVIICMPKHAETVTATSINLSKIGVTVIGLGNGLSRPTFTYGAAAATITVSAADCAWTGCVHSANFANVAAAFTIGAAKDFRLGSATVDGTPANSFLDAGASLNFLTIITTGATANAADGLTAVNNLWVGLATTSNAFCSVLGNLGRLLLADNYVDKLATNDVGHFLTFAALVLTSARILRNTLTVIGVTSAGAGILMTATSTTNTGIVADNRIYSLDVTSALVSSTGTKLSFFDNYIPVAADKSGQIIPAIA